MKVFLAVFTFILCLATLAFAVQMPANVIGGTNNSIKGNSTSGLGIAPSTVVNYITDAGATCNGIADDSAALANAGVLMRALLAANPGTAVTLLIPSGSNCKWLSCPASADGGRPFDSLTNFTLIATGATITGGPGQCVKYSGDIIGSEGSTPVIQHKFATNLVGDTCVTMVTPGDEANYPVGRWVLVAGEGMQVNSYPPNYSMWEYAQVASTGAGSVCLTAGLKNAYPDSTVVIDLSPVSLGGGGANCSNVTCGGQGTLILMNATWGSTFHFVGGSWNMRNELEWPEQTVIIDNMTVTSTGFNEFCYTPSLTQTVIINNSNWNGAGNCKSEMDKEVDTITVNNSTVNGNFQSQSINTLTLNNTTYDGTFPLHTICNNSTIRTNGGATKWDNSFGTMPQTFAGTNCNMPSGMSAAGAFAVFGNYIPTGGPGSGDVYYDGAGHFKKDPTDIYGGSPFFPPWLSRGGVMTTQMDGLAGRCGLQDCGTHFTITGSQYSPLTSTAGALVVSTNNTLTATAPAPALGAIFPTPLTFPATVTCAGCFGTQQALDLNFAGAQNKPAFTYSNRTYTCSNNIANVAGSLDINTPAGFSLTGNFTSIKLNVTVADTNPSDAGALFGTKPQGIWNTVLGSGSAPLLASIDVAQTGLRTITQTGVSGSVGIDALTAPGANTRMFLDNVVFIVTGVTNGPAAQCPVINAEWIMND